jgi:ABC-type nitrate/sulfonate/bicarbonate transport system substrate-binding protein
VENMKKKITVLALSALLYALSASAQAQQPKKIYRIGYLSATDPAPESARSEAIRLAPREMGHIEGTSPALQSFSQN